MQLQPLLRLQKPPSVSLVSIEMMVGLFNSLCRVEPEKSAELVFDCKLTLPVPFGRHAAELDALKLLQSATESSRDSPHFHSNSVFTSMGSV